MNQALVEEEKGSFHPLDVPNQKGCQAYQGLLDLVCSVPYQQCDLGPIRAILWLL